MPPALPPLDLQSSGGHLRRDVDLPGRILIVDDELGIRDLLSQALGSAGFVVACAEDGEAGWGALCAERFDLLITDHVMPRLTGLDLLRRVRTSRRDLPVIVISGEMPCGERDFLPRKTGQTRMSDIGLWQSPVGRGSATVSRGESRR